MARERVQLIRRPCEPRVAQRHKGARVATSLLIDEDALLLVLECRGQDPDQPGLAVQHIERGWIGARPGEIPGVEEAEIAPPVQLRDRADDCPDPPDSSPIRQPACELDAYP